MKIPMFPVDAAEQHSKMNVGPLSISSDPKLVEESLRRRDEIERLNIAKAMLRESYLQALRSSHPLQAQE